MAQQVCKNEYIGEIVFFPQNWYGNPTNDWQQYHLNFVYKVANVETQSIRDDPFILLSQQWVELIYPNEKGLYAGKYSCSNERLFFIVSQHLVRNKNSSCGFSLRYEHESYDKRAAIGDKYTNPETASLKIICILAHRLQ